MPYKNPADKRAWNRRDPKRFLYRDSARERHATKMLYTKYLNARYSRLLRAERTTQRVLSRALVEIFKEAKTRQCTRCRKVKQRRYFYRDTRALNGMARKCKACCASMELIRKRLFKQLMDSVGGRCVECHTKRNLTVDHVLPVSAGGNDEPSNLTILCVSCNSRKHARVVI